MIYFQLNPTPALQGSAQHYARYTFNLNPVSFTVSFQSGASYPATNIQYNAQTRHLRCQAHIWRYDLIFAPDFSHILMGFVWSFAGDFWYYGLNAEPTPEILELMPNYVSKLEYRQIEQFVAVNVQEEIPHQ